MRERLCTVYEVLIDVGDDSGAAADGTHVMRFKRRDEADRCAAVSKGPHGQPARVNVAEVSKRLAQRWGVA